MIHNRLRIILKRLTVEIFSHFGVFAPILLMVKQAFEGMNATFTTLKCHGMAIHIIGIKNVCAD